MGKNYYYLVAGLPELTPEDSKLSYTVSDFKTEIYPDLSAVDKRLVDLFYMKFDNDNVLKLLKEKDAVIDNRGLFTAEELNGYIAVIKEGTKVANEAFPSYLSAFIYEYFNTPTDNISFQEDTLAALYYEYAMKCDNRFISSWFEFNLSINNILVALMSRKYEWDVAPNIVGTVEVSETLRTSGARDFGLSSEVAFLEDLLKINEVANLVEREKKLDMLRWNWMEKTVFFKYFSIERLFVFLLQLEMIERWVSLDREKGNKLFRSIIETLKNDVSIPSEFR